MAGDIKSRSNCTTKEEVNTLHKVYTAVLEKRLDIKMDEKKMLPDSQAGFRKGTKTTDNIHVLNFIV